MSRRTTRRDATAAARVAQRGLPARGVCILAGLLCALGLMSASALRSGDLAHPRTHGVAAAAVVADGHGVNVRTDQHAVASAAPAGPGTGTVRTIAAEQAVATGNQGVSTVRTRGPPATQA